MGADDDPALRADHLHWTGDLRQRRDSIGRSFGDTHHSPNDLTSHHASAAAQGAPQATQCADRFHLLKNLGEALEGLLAHHLAAERKRQTQATLDVSAPVWQSKRATRLSPTLLRLQQYRREERLAHYEQVIALHKLGM